MLTVRRPPSLRRAARMSDASLPADGIDGPWPGSEVEVGGNRLFVRRTPSPAPAAEPALMVHGLGGSSGHWTELAGLLRDRLAVEAIDLPGFGRSGPPVPDDYSPDGHAQAVISYLDRFPRGPVHLIGNSMGGTVAIIVAAARPDLVRTLTLISPAVPDIKMRLHALRHDWRIGVLVVPLLGMGALRRMSRMAVEQRVQATIRTCFVDPARLPERRFQEMVDAARERISVPWADEALLRSTRGLVRSHFLHNRGGWAALRRIAAPSLVVWGDTDRLVAADLAPYVAAAIPDSRLVVLAGVGHTAMLEDPASTARAVLGMLEDLR